MSLYTVTTSFTLNQNPSKPRPLCRLLLEYNVSCCNAFLQHAVFEACCTGFNLEYTSVCVDAVVPETDGLFLVRVTGCLLVWKAQSFVVRGESRPHELFSFIWRCYYCSLSVFARLPLFNPSPHHLCLCPLFVCPRLSFLWSNSLPSSYCCCVTTEMLVSGEQRGGCFLGNVCNPGNRSLTCSGINPPLLVMPPETQKHRHAWLHVLFPSYITCILLLFLIYIYISFQPFFTLPPTFKHCFFSSIWRLRINQ